MSLRVPHAAPREVSVQRPGAQRMGFFTDTTVCIGCKACEVACKQWNDLPAEPGQFRRGGSYDHTGSLGATTWRHVRFIENLEPSQVARDEARRALANGLGGASPNIPAARSGPAPGPDSGNRPGDPAPGSGGVELDLLALAGGAAGTGGGTSAFTDHDARSGQLTDLVADGSDRWIFMSDVCKHCTHAGCMDACPTGALIRTEFETVVLQSDVCNGCGYCVPSCPFGVVARSPEDGRASKCTLCYDRLQDGLEPACAKACPTDSIQFGPYEELLETAGRRVATLADRGLESAYLYGAGDAPEDSLAGGLGAFFLLTEPPERYGLPAEADSPIQENVVVATVAAMTAACGAAALMALTLRRGGPRSPRRVSALTGVAIAVAAWEALHERARDDDPAGGAPDGRDEPGGSV